MLHMCLAWGLQILRVVDSLQLTANHSVATPVDWKHGEDVVVVPTLSDDQAKEKVGISKPQSHLAAHDMVMF